MSVDFVSVFMPSCVRPLLIDLFVCLHLDVRAIHCLARVSRRAREILLNYKELWLELLYLNYHLSACEQRMHKRTPGAAQVIAEAMRRLVLSADVRQARTLYCVLHRHLYLNYPLEMATSDWPCKEELLHVLQTRKQLSLPGSQCNVVTVLVGGQRHRSFYSHKVATQYGYAKLTITCDNHDISQMTFVYMTTVVDVVLDDQLFCRPSFYTQTMLVCGHFKSRFPISDPLLVDNAEIHYRNIPISSLCFSDALSPQYMFWPPTQRQTSAEIEAQRSLEWQSSFVGASNMFELFLRLSGNQDASTTTSYNDQVIVHGSEDRDTIEFAQTDGVYNIHLYAAKQYRNARLVDAAFAFGFILMELAADCGDYGGDDSLFQLFDKDNMYSVGKPLQLRSGCYALKIVERIYDENGCVRSLRVAFYNMIGHVGLFYYNFDLVSNEWLCLAAIPLRRDGYQHVCVTADGFVMLDRNYRPTCRPRLWFENANEEEESTNLDDCARLAIRQACARIAHRAKSHDLGEVHQ